MVQHDSTNFLTTQLDVVFLLRATEDAEELDIQDLWDPPNDLKRLVDVWGACVSSSSASWF